MLRFIDGADEATIYVYGGIGSGWDDDDVTAKQFADALDKAKGRPVCLRINSGGGDVFDAYAMYQMLKEYKGRSVARIDGLAASAASYFCLAADEVVISDAGMMMIHNAWSCTCGNADDMRKCAETLDAIDSNIVGIYSRKCGKPEADIREAMAAETWFGSQQALEFGLVDSVFEEDEKIAASVSRKVAGLYARMPEVISVADGHDDKEEETEHEAVTVSAEAAADEREARYKALRGGLYLIR